MSYTIAAISTPAGAAGLGVVRLSGDDAIAVAAQLFRPIDAARPLSSLKGYTAAYGTVFDGDEAIDDAVLLVFRAPKSYTGEDVGEISCHGGLLVLEKTLQALIKAGAEPVNSAKYYIDTVSEENTYD